MAQRKPFDPYSHIRNLSTKKTLKDSGGMSADGKPRLVSTDSAVLIFIFAVMLALGFACCNI